MKTYFYVVVNKKGKLISKKVTRQDARWDIWDKGDKILQVEVDINKGKVVR